MKCLCCFRDYWHSMTLSSGHGQQTSDGVMSTLGNTFIESHFGEDEGRVTVIIIVVITWKYKMWYYNM